MPHSADPIVLADPDWLGSYTPGGALVALDTWCVDGEVVGIRGVVQRLGGQGSPVGPLVPQPVVGREEGDPQRSAVLYAPAQAVWSEGSHESVGYQPLRAVGLCADPEPKGLSAQCVVRRAPEGHVLVGLGCGTLGHTLVTVTGYFDRLASRCDVPVGEGRKTSVRRPAASVGDRWMNRLIDELLALRSAGSSRWSHWPAEERRLCPLEVVVPVPEEGNRVLWVRARHGRGVVTALRVQAGGVELVVNPQDWGDAFMLYRVSLDDVPPGPTSISFSTDAEWLLVMWLEVTAGRARG